MTEKKNVVVIGGGTGTFTVLSGLKEYPLELTAVVAMTDNGGSTGRLRDEYGVLPPGDLRQCLVALSDAPEHMRELFNFRYDRGELLGHSFGNLFISTLEQVTGSFEAAVQYASEILRIHGRVLPVTLTDTHLRTTLQNGAVLEGESALSDCRFLSEVGIAQIALTPACGANPAVIAAIEEADMVVMGPGNLYSSLIPLLLVEGVAAALSQTNASRVFVANLMNKRGQTDGFSVDRYVSTLESYASGVRLFDAVLYNTSAPSGELLERYATDGEPVAAPSCSGSDRKYVGADLLSDTLYTQRAGDQLARTLIRHDSEKLARTLTELDAILSSNG